MSNEAAPDLETLRAAELAAEVAEIAVQPLPPEDTADGAAATAIPRVSVVMPTCGRPRLLRRCLGALTRQSMPPDAYEILVVDDGRSEATQRVVALFSERAGAPRIVYLQPPLGARGPAAARNAGWRAARAPLIAFTDDDTVPARDWLERGIASLPDWASAASGRVRVPVPAMPSDWQRSSAGLDGAEFVTANCFVRRAALSVVGGFDERFERPWREDSDLYFALLEKGYRVVAAPSAVVLHPVRVASWGVSMKVQRNMLFDALLYKKHRDLYRSKISPLPPIRYYVVVALLVAAALVATGGYWKTAALAFSGWLAWTAWFTVFRLRDTRHDAAHIAEMAVTSMAIPPLAVFWRLAGALRYRVLFA
ncbi:MAG TPA: glycosyltransferase [Burkholderiales bacterium]|nr:glycosyltransferase [Burkholderiales bacterium]